MDTFSCTILDVLSLEQSCWMFDRRRYFGRMLSNVPSQYKVRLQQIPLSVFMDAGLPTRYVAEFMEDYRGHLKPWATDCAKIALEAARQDSRAIVAGEAEWISRLEAMAEGKFPSTAPSEWSRVPARRSEIAEAASRLIEYCARFIADDSAIRITWIVGGMRQIGYATTGLRPSTHMTADYSKKLERGGDVYLMWCRQRLYEYLTGQVSQLSPPSDSVLPDVDPRMIRV